jgi:hypothetical protein
MLAFAAPIALAALATRLQVRIVTGALELPAGSLLELRIYDTLGVRKVPLTHRESWPPHTTMVIPLTLAAGLDPRTVKRFALYYEPSTRLTPTWEVAAADVEYYSAGQPPEKLLNTTLAGAVQQDGELSTEERDLKSMACATDADCDDGRNCNGHERCAPRSAGADARGCVAGAPLVCPVNQVCTEQYGCRGVEGALPEHTAPQSAAPH